MEDLDKKIKFLKEYKNLCEKHQLHLAWGYDRVEGIKVAYPSLYEVILKTLDITKYDLADKLGIDVWELVEEHFRTELNERLNNESSIN